MRPFFIIFVLSLRFVVANHYAPSSLEDWNAPYRNRKALYDLLRSGRNHDGNKLFEFQAICLEFATFVDFLFKIIENYAFWLLCI